VRDKLKLDSVLIMEGTVSHDDYRGGLGMRVTRVTDLLQIRNEQADHLQIELDADKLPVDFNTHLVRLLKPYKGGNCPVKFRVKTAMACGEIVVGEEWRMSPTDELLRGLQMQFGRSAVSLHYKES
jgi:DNA polymerase-3 subunit alpha